MTVNQNSCLIGGNINNDKQWKKNENNNISDENNINERKLLEFLYALIDDTPSDGVPIK